MKKLFFGLIVFIAMSNIANAQSEARYRWPYGCRVWTIGINVGFFSATSEVTLCCLPANWKHPPIDCVEINSRLLPKPDLVFQYIMIDELENNVGKKIESSEIEVYSDKLFEDDDNVKYGLIKDTYKIELNERNERFVKIVFKKIN